LAVKVRLTRVGSKKNPIWRVVVADGRSPRDGRSIETIGHYNPQTQPSRIEIDRDRLQHWLDRGAQPSNTVKKLMRAENTGHEMPAREAPAPVATPPKPKAEPAVEAAPAEAEPVEAPTPEADAPAPEAEAPADAEAAAEEVAAEQETSEQPAPDPAADAEAEADMAAEADAPAEGDSSDDS
jgi:small subunit ribosomal protein S16